MAKIFFPGIGRKSNIGGKKSKLWNFNFRCNEKNDEIFFFGNWKVVNIPRLLTDFFY